MSLTIAFTASCQASSSGAGAGSTGREEERPVEASAVKHAPTLYRYYNESDPCEGATRSFHAELFADHPATARGGLKIIDKDKPVVTLHMVEEPGGARGRYVELDTQRSGHLYQRGAWITWPQSILETKHGARILRDDDHFVTLDAVAMRSAPRRDPIRISRDGDVWWERRSSTTPGSSTSAIRRTRQTTPRRL